MEREQAEDDGLPLLPGFREMALRRMSQDRRRLVAQLASQRHAAGLSQTEVAARMGTSQSAVARLEAGEGDVRASTLERYAAAVGSHLTWQAHPSGPNASGLPPASPHPAAPAAPATTAAHTVSAGPAMTAAPAAEGGRPHDGPAAQ